MEELVEGSFGSDFDLEKFQRKLFDEKYPEWLEIAQGLIESGASPEDVEQQRRVYQEDRELKELSEVEFESDGGEVTLAPENIPMAAFKASELALIIKRYGPGNIDEENAASLTTALVDLAYGVGEEVSDADVAARIIELVYTYSREDSEDTVALIEELVGTMCGKGKKKDAWEVAGEAVNVINKYRRKDSSDVDKVIQGLVGIFKASAENQVMPGTTDEQESELNALAERLLELDITHDAKIIDLVSRCLNGFTSKHGRTTLTPWKTVYTDSLQDEVVHDFTHGLPIPMPEKVHATQNDLFICLSQLWQLKSKAAFVYVLENHGIYDEAIKYLSEHSAGYAETMRVHKIGHYFMSRIAAAPASDIGAILAEAHLRDLFEGEVEAYEAENPAIKVHEDMGEIAIPDGKWGYEQLEMEIDIPYVPPDQQQMILPPIKHPRKRSSRRKESIGQEQIQLG